MGQTFTIYPVNILEIGTVTVSGITDAGYPVSRLYDRATAFFWKATEHEPKIFDVAQGFPILPASILAVGYNNFAGALMALEYAESSSGPWYEATPSWNPYDHKPFAVEFSAITGRYWRLTESAVVNPRCSEIFLGPGYTFTIQRSPKPYGGNLANVQWNRTVGGLERSTKFGGIRRSRCYSVFLDAAELASFEEAVGYLDDYSRPFFFKDHRGEYYWARLADEPYFDHDHKTHTHITLKFTEML